MDHELLMHSHLFAAARGLASGEQVGLEFSQWERGASNGAPTSYKRKGQIASAHERSEAQQREAKRSAPAATAAILMTSPKPTKQGK